MASPINPAEKAVMMKTRKKKSDRNRAKTQTLTKMMTKTPALPRSAPKTSPQSQLGASYLADSLSFSLWSTKLGQLAAHESLLNGLFEIPKPLSPEATACLALGVDPIPLDPQNPTVEEISLAKELADRMSRVMIRNGIRLNHRPKIVPSMPALEPPAS